MQDLHKNLMNLPEDQALEWYWSQCPVFVEFPCTVELLVTLPVLLRVKNNFLHHPDKGSLGLCWYEGNLFLRSQLNQLHPESTQGGHYMSLKEWTASLWPSFLPYLNMISPFLQLHFNFAQVKMLLSYTPQQIFSCSILFKMVKSWEVSDICNTLLFDFAYWATYIDFWIE